MGVDLTAIVIVTVIFGSIFGPRLLRELAIVLGRDNPKPAEQDEKLAAEVQALRRDVEQMRVVYTDKILSLERRMRELERTTAVEAKAEETPQRALTERPAVQEQTQSGSQLPQTSTQG